jgi:hypothetical protein
MDENPYEVPRVTQQKEGKQSRWWWGIFLFAVLGPSAASFLPLWHNTDNHGRVYRTTFWDSWVTYAQRSPPQD